ncbi:MAG: hypothetical protein VX730_07220 [Pseudomonadota bacterium]|nr:hypothetical protein [Pseudomonadota bacterium]
MNSVQNGAYLKTARNQLILKALMVLGFFIGGSIFGLFDLILPDDMLTHVWIGAMALIFLGAALFQVLPYQAMVDREVALLAKVKQQVSGGEEGYKLALDTDTLNDKEKNTFLAQVLAKLQGLRGQKDVEVDDLVLLDWYATKHAQRAKGIHWVKRNLLTYGIVGTYVGIRLATAGADIMASGETEAVFQFVVMMFEYLGLAIMSTLAGLLFGSVFIGHAIDRTERTVQDIANDLHLELYSSGFLAWMNGAGKETHAS